MRRFHETLFTPAVRAGQERLGSPYAAMPREPDAAPADAALTPAEAAFLARRDSFYLASTSEDGWPYIQHRGGPPGFVRVIDRTTLAWAEFAGNRQYISLGNVAANDRVALFFMDYPARHRLKLLGHLTMHEPAERPDLAAAVALDAYRARIERVAVVEVAGFDWNCPQHMTPRFTAAEIEAAMERRRREIAPG
ncbi:pyridoxamine 5'-phosphate oxidase family protein [Methylobacterium sp. ID0610]|uniref:pyridoxamine 5'-phosphate oxidase family protein n=1 Tax=Methylobacterium carpenticola TaxID=3344827 RepID=UPI0036C644D3